MRQCAYCRAMKADKGWHDCQPAIKAKTKLEQTLASIDEMMAKPLPRHQIDKK